MENEIKIPVDSFRCLPGNTNNWGYQDEAPVRFIEFAAAIADVLADFPDIQDSVAFGALTYRHTYIEHEGALHHVEIVSLTQEIGGLSISGYMPPRWVRPYPKYSIATQKPVLAPGS